MGTPGLRTGATLTHDGVTFEHGTGVYHVALKDVSGVYVHRTPEPEGRLYVALDAAMPPDLVGTYPDATAMTLRMWPVEGSTVHPADWASAIIFDVVRGWCPGETMIDDVLNGLAGSRPPSSPSSSSSSSSSPAVTPPRPAPASQRPGSPHPPPLDELVPPRSD